MTFFRVGNVNKTHRGLWYSKEGVFTGDIHKKYSFYKSASLDMKFDKEVAGFLSVVKNLADLYNWFSEEDLKKLYSFGFRVLAYRTNKYKAYKNHFLIPQDTDVFSIYEVLE